ncbi:MAG: SDR family NAD(P)-dependent oxidoreductase [Verrucomicrobiota bacterium]
MNRFENQVAVVTGGGDGLGFEIARRLAREGASVWIVDRSNRAMEKRQEEAEKEGLRLAKVNADVAEESEVAGLFEAVVEKEGRLDVVVNCAGVVGPNGMKITEVPVQGFDDVCAVNLRGSFNVSKQALRQMEGPGYGRILLIASIAGKEGNAGMCCYSASKAGVIGLTKAIGKEYAETGITINALAPAVIRTAMVAGMEPEQVTYMTEKIPMKRCGTLEEVASLACWIVSPEASFNTGFTFDLSGGRAVY